MLVIGIILIIVGVIGLAMGSMMFGDIALAAMIGAAAAILSGIGFILANNAIKKVKGAISHGANNSSNPNMPQ
ncbi:MAG: hypothetical protein FWE48_05445 [Coriobacteriia bacterium]|nr:hypothetical protein [Coriobacteriia bacterium]MCL2746512.1 hypothetical protein [Coriobacteriia bacterium]MCL2870379.1 hypothetical protein [Coriobacteriia bacterium]